MFNTFSKNTRISFHGSAQIWSRVIPRTQKDRQTDRQTSKQVDMMTPSSRPPPFPPNTPSKYKILCICAPTHLIAVTKVCLVNIMDILHTKLNTTT